jgi:hypothetical protein
MFGRSKNPLTNSANDAPRQPLKEALREARIEAAERSAVVVDLRDAEAARLELLNEALDPAFKEIPSGVELFDRGVSKGDVPRLWVDVIAHVEMGRDKRQYRFVQDTRYGRKVLAESNDIAAIVEAVTHYVAARIIERERALAEDENPLHARLHRGVYGRRPRRGWRMFRAFLFGLIAGCVALFAVLWVVASRLPH